MKLKYYFADILTFTRFILAGALMILALFVQQANIGAGLILFIAAELTDAFDGTCATRWPFPKNKTPKYRKYAARYDMYADTLTVVAVLLFFINHVNLVAGLTIAISYGVLALIIEAIVYGRLFGHPDDCAPHSLTRRNFPLAKKIILLRRNIYLILLATITLWLLFTTTWPLAVKISLTILALLISIFLWFFLSQRRHHISRDATELESKLSHHKCSCASLYKPFRVIQV